MLHRRMALSLGYIYARNVKQVHTQREKRKKITHTHKHTHTNTHTYKHTQTHTQTHTHKHTHKHTHRHTHTKPNTDLRNKRDQEPFKYQLKEGAYKMTVKKVCLYVK